MSLVVRCSRLASRCFRIRCLTAVSLLGVALVSCTDQATSKLPTTPPQGDPTPIDPSDPAFGRSSHVVAPGGRSANTGDSLAPWDLASALAGAGGRVTPGDTIWLRGATYRGAFTSRVAGSPGAPVVVRAWPRERVILEHQGSASTTLSVHGEWTVFLDLEVTNSDPVRDATTTASEFRPNGIVNSASHTRFVNLVVHDAGVGFYNYSHAADVEVYGSILYNNGWQGPDRGHGHAMYVKSEVGPLVLRENVIFNQFGWGVHAYTNEGTGELNNILVERNVAFGNGSLANAPQAENILLGGNGRSTGSVVRANIAWFAPGGTATNIRVGFGGLQNGTVEVRDNVAIGGDPVLRVGQWDLAAFADNTLAGAARMVELADPSLAGYSWAGTEQYRDPLSTSWVAAGTASPFVLWTALTGLGLSDLVGSSAPSTPLVAVWPNRYESGRGFVVVVNWPRQPSVLADLGAVLGVGEGYTLHNVQDLHGPPVLEGTYGGPVSLPMAGVSPPVPIGRPSSRAPRSGPEVDVFLVRRR